MKNRRFKIVCKLYIRYVMQILFPRPEKFKLDEWINK